MLLFIIVMYIISELPQSILLLLCVFLEDFFTSVYDPLGELIDLMTLVNTAINFITYMAMSSQFRNTFIECFCACLRTVTCDRCGRKSALQTTKYTKAPPTSV